jgi:hypothetical protein
MSIITREATSESRQTVADVLSGRLVFRNSLLALLGIGARTGNSAKHYDRDNYCDKTRDAHTPPQKPLLIMPRMLLENHS